MMAEEERKIYQPGMYLKRGDFVYINSIRDIASNLKEYIGFMRYSFEVGFDFEFGDAEESDTRRSMGALMRDILAGVDKFDDEYFQNFPEK